MSRGDRKNAGTLDDKMMLSMKNSKISHLITNSNMSYRRSDNSYKLY